MKKKRKGTIQEAIDLLDDLHTIMAKDDVPDYSKFSARIIISKFNLYHLKYHLNKPE